MGLRVEAPPGLGKVLDSTETPLAANASYTGPPKDCIGYRTVRGSCYADQAGTLRVQFSGDNLLFDSEETFAYAAGERLGFIVDVVNRYVRLVFENGAADQTVFRLSMRGAN